VAGGPSGTGRVIDVKTGKIIRNYTFTTETSIINDVILTRDYAWFTDSQRPELYGVLAVAVIKLNASGTRGRLVDTLTSKDFDIPTTVAAFGKSLYLPNARFTTPPTPDTPYWITRIDRR
jgi:hypothetical protein